MLESNQGVKMTEPQTIESQDSSTDLANIRIGAPKSDATIEAIEDAAKAAREKAAEEEVARMINDERLKDKAKRLGITVEKVEEIEEKEQKIQEESLLRPKDDPPPEERGPDRIWDKDLIPDKITLEKLLFVKGVSSEETREIAREALSGIVDRLIERDQDARDRQLRNEDLQPLDNLAIHTMDGVRKLKKLVDAGKVREAREVLLTVYQTAQAMELEISQGAGLAIEYIELKPYAGEMLSPNDYTHARLATFFYENTSGGDLAWWITRALGRDKVEMLETTMDKAHEQIAKYNQARAEVMRDRNLTKKEFNNLPKPEQQELLIEAATRLHLGKDEQLAILNGRQHYLKEVPATLRSAYLESQNFYGQEREVIEVALERAHDERMALFTALTGYEMDDHAFRSAAILANDATPVVMQDHWKAELNLLLTDYGVDQLSDLTPTQLAEAKYKASVNAAYRYGVEISQATGKELAEEVVSEYKKSRLDTQIARYDVEMGEIEAKSAPMLSAKAEQLKKNIKDVTSENKKEPGTLAVFKAARNELINANRTLDRESQRIPALINSLEAKITEIDTRITTRTGLSPEQIAQGEAKMEDLKRKIIGHRTQLVTYQDKVDDAQRNLDEAADYLIGGLTELTIDRTQIVDTNNEIDPYKVEKELRAKRDSLDEEDQRIQKKKEKAKGNAQSKKDATVEIKSATDIEKVMAIQQGVHEGHIKPEDLNAAYVREILGIKTEEILPEAKMRILLVRKLGLTVDETKEAECWTAIREQLKNRSRHEFSQALQYILDNRIEAAIRGDPFGDPPLREVVAPIQAVEQLTDLQDLLKRDAGVSEGTTGVIEPATVNGERYVVVVQEGKDRVYHKTTDGKGRTVLKLLAPDERRQIHHDLCITLGTRCLRRELYTVGAPVNLVCTDGRRKRIQEENGRLVIYDIGRRLGFLTEEVKRSPHLYLEPLVAKGETHLAYLDYEEQDKIERIKKKKGDFNLSDDGKTVTVQLDGNNRVEIDLARATLQAFKKIRGVGATWHDQKIKRGESDRVRISAFDPFIELSAEEKITLRPHFENVEILHLAGKDYEANINDKGRLVICQVRETGQPRNEYPDFDFATFLNNNFRLGYLSWQEHQRIQYLVGRGYLRALHKKARA